MTQELYNVPITAMDGKKTTLKPYAGQVLLIVNVASRCGFTPQYAELEKLYEDYKEQGLVVLGFPCNQFLRQEPASNEAIKTFAESCYRVTFPLFAKIDVKGEHQAPLYAYIAEHIQKKPWWKLIPWNFTKILVDKNGDVVRRYLPTTPIKTIRKEIEARLPT